MGSSVEFQPYLDSIISHYGKWQRLYTPTDAEGRETEEYEETPFFDFDLIVQSVEKTEPDGAEATAQKPQGKIERLEVMEGLQQHIAADHKIPQVLLIGRPGSGKSTALAGLMSKLAQEEQVPVLVELRSWQISVLELIRVFLRRNELQLTVAQVEALLDEQRLVLLVDGVNELPSETARRDVNEFRKNYPKVPMVFTTRELSFGGDLGIEKKLKMQPLTDQQMRAFIEAYLPGKAEVILQQLKGRLQELGQTPLLLWMLCSVFRKTEEIPRNLGEVFRSFTQGYEQRIKQDVVVESDRRLWSDLLQALSAAMMNGEMKVDFRVAIAPSEVHRIFSESGYLPENNVLAPQQALDDLLKHHLIQKNGDLVEFCHQLIQEYYAAEWLLKNLDSLDNFSLKRDHLNYLKWTELIVLMLSLVQSESMAIQIVKQALAIDFRLGAKLIKELKPDIRSSGISLIENLEVEDWLRKELIKKSQPKSYSQGKPSEYRHSREKYPVTDMEELYKNLYNENSKLRWEAIFSLEQIVFSPGRRVDKRATNIFLNSIHHPDPEIRWGTAHGLLICGDQTALPGLLLLADDSNENVRNSATLALRYCCDETHIDELLNFLNRLWDESNSIKDSYFSILRLLGELGGEEAVQGLLTFLDHPEADIRWEAVSALGEIKDKSTVKTLTKRLDDPSSSVRSQTAYALGEIGCRTGVPALIKHLKSSLESKSKLRDEDFRCSSLIEALGKIDCKDSIPVLRQSAAKFKDDLENGNKYLYRLSIFSLFRIGDTTSTLNLIQIVEDSKVGLSERVMASTLLGERNVKAAVLSIAKLLIDSAYTSAFPGSEVTPALSHYKDTLAAPALPFLLEATQTRSSGSKAWNAMKIIQENCKFYNYELFKSSPNKFNASKMNQASQQQNIFNIGSVGTLNTGDVTIQGDQVGIQNNYTTNPELQLAITQLQDLLTTLQTQNPNITNETEALAIIDAEFTEIQTNPGHRYSNLLSSLKQLGKQVFNLENQLQAGKATLAEVAKHYLEESVLSKAAITYLEALSEAPNQGA